jgi:uncharacterized protein
MKSLAGRSVFRFGGSAIVVFGEPERFEPMHRRKPNGDVDPRPWCRGFYAAMRLRMSDWAPLLDTSDVNHALLLPILLHCRPLRYSSRRRGHAPILDAHPLRPRELIVPHVGPRTGYA